MFQKCYTLFKIIRRKLKNSITKNVLIHIGKCGGSSVKNELSRKGIKFTEKHICKVNYLSSKKYIILVRNPISRFVSAFNWRYHLVCDEGSQKNRFKGEKAFLIKYKTINNLAEDINDPKGNLNLDFSKEHFYIHHVREDINFHIGEFLKKCNKKI